jgi:hypothetical protein
VGDTVDVELTPNAIRLAETGATDPWRPVWLKLGALAFCAGLLAVCLLVLRRRAGSWPQAFRAVVPHSST